MLIESLRSRVASKEQLLTEAEKEVLLAYFLVNPWLEHHIGNASSPGFFLFLSLHFCLKVHGHKLSSLETYFKFLRNFTEATESLPSDEIFNITDLQLALWYILPHVRSSFDLSTVEGRNAFRLWYVTIGQHDFFQEEDFVKDLLSDYRDEKGFCAKKIYFILHRLHPTLSRQLVNKQEDWLEFERAYFQLPDNEKILNGKASDINIQKLMEASDKEGVNIVGFARGELGLGEDCRMTASALLNANCPLNVYELKHGGSIPSEDNLISDAINNSLKAKKNIFNLPITEIFKLKLKWGADQFEKFYNIGYCPWELDTWPDEMNFLLTCVDEIWAPTKHIVKAFANKTASTVLHMPLSVSLPEHIECNREGFGFKSEFVFLFMFDSYSFIERKNPFATIEAFKIAFGANSNVKLVIKVMNGNVKDRNFAKLLELTSDRPNIVIFNQVMSRIQVLSLLASSDCFVSLHRSEGFGRGIAEAMLLGKPTIVTAYSGNMDFNTEDNSCLVSYDLIPVGDGYPWSTGANWAEAHVDVAAKWMQTLVSDRNLAENIGIKARCFIEEFHSPTVLGKRYKARLDEINL